MIESNGRRVLLDCGLFQGRREESNRRNRNLPFDPKSVERVVLSHAHIDHSGNLPNLVKGGYQNSIYSTFATRDLCAVMLADSAHIQRKDAEYLNKKKKLKGCEVFNKTLGLVGIGRIGKEMAKRAVGLGMKVVAYDPYVKSVEGLDAKLIGLDELLSESDFISLHLPRTDETKHMLGKAQFDKMKDGVRIVNCARGGIVDEDALYEALESGRVAGAAIDVFEKEPATDNKLFALDNVIGTPHIGASTSEGQGRVGDAVAEKITNWAKSR